MLGSSMVFLIEAKNEFEARVLVAKLGSAGIVAQVQGLCPPYPALGVAQVWVEASEWHEARELIDADLDDAFADDNRDMAVADSPERSGPVGAAHALARPVLLAVALLLLGSFAMSLPRCGAPVVRTR